MPGAILNILFCWTWMLVVFTGIGALARPVVGIRDVDSDSIFENAWIGWACTIFALQVWHLFLPVNAAAFWAISAIGILNALRVVRPRSPTDISSIFAAAVFGLCALMLANRAAGPSLNYDVGLYYLSQIRWLETYPIVPGLANLHNRFGFNQSSFLFSALTEMGPWSGRAQNLSGGILILLFAGQSLQSWLRLLRGESSVRHLFITMLFAPVMYGLTFSGRAGAAPDLPIFLLGIVISERLLFLFDPKTDSNHRQQAFFTIVTLSAAGVAVKLSFAVFASVAVAVACCGLAGPIRSRFKFRYFALAAAMLLIWIVRGVILSGYPAFPSTLGAVGADWTVPPEAASNLTDWIRAYGRSPKATPAEVLGNWEWLGPWARRIYENEKLTVVAPCALAIVSSIIGLLAYALNRTVGNSRALWLAMLPPFLGAIFWFFASPEPRFAGAAFIVLGACGAIQALLTLPGIFSARVPDFISFGGRRTAFVLLIGSTAFAALLGFNYVRRGNSPFFASGSDRGFHPNPSAEISEFTATSGLKLHVPKNTDQCWDAALPCTPEPNPNLELRVPGELKSGFRIRPK